MLILVGPKDDHFEFDFFWRNIRPGAFGRSKVPMVGPGPWIGDLTVLCGITLRIQTSPGWRLHLVHHQGRYFQGPRV